MTKTASIAGSVVLATAIGAALLFRPTTVAREELPVSTAIPPAARQIVKTKMARHDQQMRELLTRVVLLDDDGVARVGGEVFDEPALARPLAGDELNGLLPERFFVLQDELKARAKRLVIAGGNRDHEAIADEFAALAKSCIACHQVFLNGNDRAGVVTRTETQP